jgi:hypothetical protein
LERNNNVDTEGVNKQEGNTAKTFNSGMKTVENKIFEILDIKKK